MHTLQDNVTRLLITVLIALPTIAAFGETPVSDRETPVSQPIVVRDASWLFLRGSHEQ